MESRKGHQDFSLFNPGCHSPWSGIFYVFDCCIDSSERVWLIRVASYSLLLTRPLCELQLWSPSCSLGNSHEWADSSKRYRMRVCLLPSGHLTSNLWLEWRLFPRPGTYVCSSSWVWRCTGRTVRHAMSHRTRGFFTVSGQCLSTKPIRWKSTLKSIQDRNLHSKAGQDVFLLLILLWKVSMEYLKNYNFWDN